MIIVKIKKGEVINRNKFLQNLVNGLYSRNEYEFKRGTFRVKGETIDIYVAYADFAYRVVFFGDEIEEIQSINPTDGHLIEYFEEVSIYPANLFVTSKDTLQQAIREIQDDMVLQVEFFKSMDRNLEAKRLQERVTYDLEMIRELGYCSGIENYSRYFDRRPAGSRPFCLIDCFPKDFLMVVDESHVTVSQIRAMYGGDRSRKTNLVDYGFRLPSALDNRPLKFNEFESLTPQTIFVSATPADYELEKSAGVIVEQVIRPTGLLDPVIEVRPSLNQIDDLMNEISKKVHIKERVLVTTLTKRMDEELSKYLIKLDIKCRYIHSEVDTLERVEILRDLRLGNFDVLIGVNLLREGLDLPEVSLVAILDADKEGFLRSARSLTQTIGRAARHINGKAIMYADKITDSMQKTIDETNRRREKQLAYNDKNNITPTAISKTVEQIMQQTSVVNKSPSSVGYYTQNDSKTVAAEPLPTYITKDKLRKMITKTKRDMEQAAKVFDFVLAATLRDEMFLLEKQFKERFGDRP